MDCDRRNRSASFIITGTRISMTFFSRFFGKGKTPPGGPRENSSSTDDDGPFMEFPSDDYDSSLAAMTAAFERLKAGSYADRWITFGAQGQGHREDSDQSEDVNVRGNTLDLRGQTLDV